MASPLRVAVVGLGTVAQSVYLPMLQRRHDRFTLAAVVDISPRRLEEASEKWQIPVERRYASVADLMTAVRSKSIEIDAVVFSADGVKSVDVLQIIKRGIPVLVEPPVGYGPSDLAKIADFERIAGRPLLMVGYAQMYETAVRRFVEENEARDLRILEFETIMPSSAVIYGKHHVTASTYDLSVELRNERREELEAAVLEGVGEASLQRDRDIYVKGLLTGIVSQLAMLRSMYGPLDRIDAVRQWPEQVIPGSLEIQGSMLQGPHVRLVWHYLPFAPEFHDSLRYVTTRRQGRVVVPSEAELDARGTYSMTQRVDGAVTEAVKRSEESASYSLLEAFYEFVSKGTAPLYGLSDAVADTECARTIIAQLVAADGRSLDAVAEPEDDSEDQAASAPEGESVPVTESAPEGEPALGDDIQA